MNPTLRLRWLLTTACTLALAAPALAADAKDNTADDTDEPVMSAGTFSGIAARGIGPALMSGRIVDLAINSARPGEYYVASASGGVWKTTNWGTTFTPIFDGQASFSIGCITLDPNNPNTVWVGTGENNSQRSVSWGDGVYKSLDAGATWTNMGLKESEHIGMIRVHPSDPNTVFVAAMGPLWRSGGDRGLYRTTDGGATWECVLTISEDTGVNEVHFDPHNPKVMYATAYQRRRHVWTLINGGPESGIYKSTDGGATWRTINAGLPEVDKGRIGLAIAPTSPNIVYAIVEAADGKGGTFRSTNAGEQWTKASDHMTTSPQYYNELFPDPVDPNTVYCPDTFTQFSHDGGVTWTHITENHKHVDSHCIWVDPTNTNHWLIGCDGGLYETWDHSENWHFKANLPITQFYKIAIDDDVPFYNVYGGTQDNNTQGGPTRTLDRIGIANEHWFITVGGDGFEAGVEPGNPDIVYSEWQHAGLVRFDRKSGEVLDIKPQEKPGEEPYVWNWDSPFVISPHSPTRLYFACDRVLRSDDRGDSWTVISEDMTRKLDRNTLEVMGKVQKPDAVAKHASTSIYGNCVSLDESPIKEGLLYVGTDDGLVHVSDNAGGAWRRIDTFPGVPDQTYVSCLRASQDDENTVFASFDNHKNGDFKPYLLRSTDRGASWTSIAGDLPDNGPVYAIQQDHLDPDLIFVGTEFGAFFTYDSGQHWIKIAGLPPIAVRDIEVQRRESDLVFGTFGRGFYVLDDYSPLRTATESVLTKDAELFGVKDALSYIPRARLEGRDGRGVQGDSNFTAPNPDFGAIITYHLANTLETRKEKRHEAEKEDGWEYPTIAQFRDEDREREPRIILTITDASGSVVARITAPREKGFHRVAWDLRYPPSTPVSLAPPDLDPWSNAPTGPLVAPGEYTVTLAKEIDGEVIPLADPRSFKVVALNNATFAAEDKAALLAFQQKAARLQRAATGASSIVGEAQTRINLLREAVLKTPGISDTEILKVHKLNHALDDVRIALSGDPTMSRRAEPEGPSILGRTGAVIDGLSFVTCSPTKTQRDQYEYAADAFTIALANLRQIVLVDLQALEKEFDAAGAPWTPGRFPVWKKE